MASLHSIETRRSSASPELPGPLDLYLAEKDAGLAEAMLGRLIVERVEPLAVRIVSSRMRRHGSTHHNQIEDVTSEAIVAFLLHAEELRQGRSQAVANLDAFIATLAARACNDYFRRVFPAFHGLRNKLRYLLEKYPEFARWKDAGSGIWICGLAQWQRDGSACRAVGEPAQFEQTDAAVHPAEQLRRVFAQAAAPMPFNDLALVMARLWNIQEISGAAEEPGEYADGRYPADVVMSQKQSLGRLWQLICDLPRAHRAALLLNLRSADGGCSATLLVSTGIASVRQIAAALEIPAVEFAEIWRRLPLGDLEVASLLGLTRQQVINLRKGARMKLARQMQENSQGSGNTSGNSTTDRSRTR